MEASLVSTAVVGLAGIGDKTQILSLMLTARFQRPLPIICWRRTRSGQSPSSAYGRHFYGGHGRGFYGGYGRGFYGGYGGFYPGYYGYGYSPYCYYCY